MPDNQNMVTNQPPLLPRVIKWMLLLEGVTWSAVAVGFGIFYLNRLSYMTVALVCGLMLTCSAWLLFLGLKINQQGKSIKKLAIVTIFVILIASIFDELGFYNFLMIGFNLILFTLLLISRKDHLSPS